MDKKNNVSYAPQINCRHNYILYLYVWTGFKSPPTTREQTITKSYPVDGPGHLNHIDIICTLRVRL